MNHLQLETAIREGIPFAVKMADGNAYHVTAATKHIVQPTYLLLVTEDGLAHILPIRTMAGITYLPATP